MSDQSNDSNIKTGNPIITPSEMRFGFRMINISCICLMIIFVLTILFKLCTLQGDEFKSFLIALPGILGSFFAGIAGILAFVYGFKAFQKKYE